MNPDPIPTVLVNGEPGDAVAVSDRGFTLGDGLFETIAIRAGRPRFWADHCERLAAGCARLALAPPDFDRLRAEIDRVRDGAEHGTLRITVTRGPGPRGYALPREPRPTRVVAFQSTPAGAPAPVGLRLRWCTTRLALQPALAGLKHLNRLEQILARSEWTDPAIDEGVMQATDGRVIECTATNLFLVRSGTVITPALDDCGVGGVMRARILQGARTLGVDVAVRDVRPDEVALADALFVTSATRGIAPVARLDERMLSTDDPVVAQLSRHLDDECRANRE